MVRSRDEVVYILDWFLEWLEDSSNKERIAHLIAEILEEVKEWKRKKFVR